MTIEKISKTAWTIYIILIIVVLTMFAYLFQNKNLDIANENVVATSTTTNTSSSTITNTEKASVKTTPTYKTTTKCNLKITSPVAYTKVSMPLIVSGLLDVTDIKEACKWNAAYSRAGNAELFYNKNGEGWKSAGAAVPIFTSSYAPISTTTLKISVSLNLYVKQLGLASGTPLKIVFTELNIPERSNPNTFDYLLYLK